MSMMSRRLREKLQGQEMIVAPGCYDCLTARAIERYGFSAAYMTGGGTSGAFGYPDYGLITMSEMVENAGRIADALSIPLIADADTGFGNEINVIRTVREFEKRGVAGIHIEDQEFPKLSGHLEGKRVIPLEDYARKIAAAANARRDSDFLIIARTDARAVEGFDQAVKRANAALSAGADVIFFEAAQSMEELDAIPRLVEGPCLLGIDRKSKTPLISLGEAKKMGYKIAIIPGVLLRPVLAACDAALAELSETLLPPALPNELSQTELSIRFGATEWNEMRERFSKD